MYIFYSGFTNILENIFLFQTSRGLQDYQGQAKMLFRKLNEHSPARSSIETGIMMFHYIIENGVCYLTLSDKSFSKRAAFSYLEDLAAEFWREYGDRVATAQRPYLFIEFGKSACDVHLYTVDI